MRRRRPMIASELGKRYLATSSTWSTQGTNFLDVKSFVRAIKECSDGKSVLEVHTRMVDRGLGSNLFLSNCVVHRYLSCRSVWDAWRLFSQLHDTDVITWTRLIAAFSQVGHLLSALQVFREMQLQGVPPDSVTFVTLLNCCAKFAALEQGKKIHTYVLERGFEVVPRVGNSLVDLYAKCSSLDDACLAFDNLKSPDVISWNTLIAAYATCSSFKETISVYQRMELEGMKSDSFTLVTILNACGDLDSIASSTVKILHKRIVALGLSSETVVCNALITMYGNGGQVQTARNIFENCCKSKDVISWNAIISAYTLAGLNVKALQLYRRMQLEGQLPNDVAFLTAMNACTCPVDLHAAKLIHSNIEESFLVSSSQAQVTESQVANALISMYGRCASMDDALKTFERMSQKDTVSWNSLIAAFSLNGFCEFALEAYHRMQLEGLRPTNITFTTVLNACSENFLNKGRLIHANLIGTGFEALDIVLSALVDMYCKCKSLDDAQQLFARHPRKGVVLWTSIIGGYADAGHARLALHLFKEMQLEGIKANKVTLVTVLNACASSLALAAEECRLLCSLVSQSGHHSDLSVKNALLNLFGKAGYLEDLERTFDELQDWDVITGTVVMSTYSQLGLWTKSIELYHLILLEGMKPNPATFVAALTSCSGLANLAVGKPIHATIVESGCSLVPQVQNSLVNFYGKCGNLKFAQQIFEKMEDKTIANSWTALMAGYAQHGRVDQARKIFQRMQQNGVTPDEISFINVLAACSHVGVVEDACYFFMAMTKDLEIAATIQHYGCMIDLLGRTGWLNEAEALVKRMTVPPDAVLWCSLLSSSRVHGNLKLAKYAAQQVVMLEPENAAVYVQLSNTYAVTKPSNVTKLEHET